MISLATMVGFYRLNTEYGLAFVSLVGLARHGLGRVLWLAAALPAGTVPHVGARDRPGLRLQLRPDHRRGAGNLQMGNLLAGLWRGLLHSLPVVAGVYLSESS